MLPSYYEYHNPVKILSGNNALENIPSELDMLQASRPIIITDEGVVKAGLIDVLVNAMGGSDVVVGAVYDKVPPDSSNVVVTDAADVYRAKKCDSIIAVGGGSAIDTAKCMNICITEGTNDLLKFQGANILKKPMRPLIVVPTTAGTGSEVTLVAVIKNVEKKVKMLFPSPRLYPDAAVLDARMTQTMPPHITAATGMDAMTHAVEAYTCLQKNPMSDAYAVAAIDLIRQYLLKAVKDGKNAEARLAMANGALMAGTAFSNSMVGMVHGLGHACGGVSHIPHGVAMGIILPHVMEYNMKKVGKLYAELLLPLAGVNDYAKTPARDRGKEAVVRVRSMLKTLHKLCKLPITLEQAGVSRDDLEAIAETAVNDGAIIVNPIEVSRADALKVLKKAYG